MTDAAIPQLVAHRGYLAAYPENTWPAVEAAVMAGACWVEFDVQMCADGTFVLLHDGDFRRTGQRSRSVFTTPLSEAQTISVHEPARLGTRFEPVYAPPLEEVLRRLSAFPACRSMVEIKHESLTHWGMQAVMNALLQRLEPHRAGCVLISYRYDALRYARDRSGIEIGWVLRDYDAPHRRLAQRLQPEFLICNHTKIAPGERLWAGGWQWVLYDVVSPELALSWAERGAALIETADIGGMLEHPLLARKACPHGL